MSTAFTKHYPNLYRGQTEMPRFKLNRNSETEEKQLFQAKLPKSLIHEINLMVKWSGNEKNYVAAELFRYALSQESDFQHYKRSTSGSNGNGNRSSHSPAYAPEEAVATRK
jgi:hypothetical protein